MSAASLIQPQGDAADHRPCPAADAALAEGRGLLAAGLAEEAARSLRQALGLQPPAGVRADIDYHLGCALLASGRAQEALAPLRRAAGDARLGGFAWLQIATAEARLGRRLRAAAGLRRVVRLRPDWVAPRLRYGEALARLGRTREAMAQVIEALRQAPGSPAAHRLHGVLLCRGRQFARATLAFAAWARAAPADAVAQLCLARVRLLAGDRGGAQAAARSAIGQDAALLRGHLLLARLALADGKPAQAQSYLRNAVAARPDLPGPRARLAALLLRRTQIDAASATAREALALDPRCSAALAVAARCHLARGEPVRAQAMITQLAQALPAALELPALRAELAARRGGGGLIRPPAVDKATAPTVVAAKPPAMPQPARPSPPQQAAAQPGVPLVKPPRVPPAAAVPATAIVRDLPAVVMARAPLYPGPGRPGFIDHLFIVRALILRDLRLKYRDNPFGFIMELVRPVAVMLAHYYLFLFLRKPMPGRIPIETFVIAGFSVWFAFNYAAQGAINGGRWPAGATALPGVTRMHMRLARAGWALLINLVFCLTATLPLSLYGDPLPLPGLPLTCAIFAMAGAMGFGFGLFMDQICHLWPVIRPLEKLTTWALFVTCALYFSLATTTPLLAAVFCYNPLLHLVEYQRHAFDPGYPVALVTLTYPALFAAGLLSAGLMAARSFSRRAHE